MASAASPSTPSGGVNASMWAGQPPSKQGWSRSGESGNTFRGGARGRPGRGGGRGGRAGRGGGRPNGAHTPRLDDKGSKPNGTQTKDPSHPSLSIIAPSTPVPAIEVSSPLAKPSNNRIKDAKPPPKKVPDVKPPRKVPPIVIEPPIATAASNSPVSATTPNRARRKRSQNRSTPSISSKKSPSSESSTSLLRPEKSPVITKDLPPHLAPPLPDTPSFDIKHDIDALVERVRAVAMDRPNTPGSHIDWAGDDDDSLPDLDDWGVKAITAKSTSSTCVSQADLISPILADALKPLPSIDIGSPLIIPAAIPAEEVHKKSVVTSVPPAVKDSKGNDTPRGAVPVPQSAKGKQHAENGQPAAPKDRKKSDASTKSVAPTASSAADKDAAVKKSPPKQTLPLHPSLPAKPVEAIDALAKRVPRKVNVPSVQVTGSADDVEPPLKSGLSESMHAPPVNGAASQDQPSERSPSPEAQGVTASMHAPVQSAPSHITTHSTPSFHPTHGRAHTIGRPGGIRVPFSPSHGSFPDGPGGERASHRDRIVNHARTHSSPPTGPGTSTAHSRTVHASRPVITVDALSRLARQLGGAAPKREHSSVAVSKE